jgi:hypothetical protein
LGILEEETCCCRCGFGGEGRKGFFMDHAERSPGPYFRFTMRDCLALEQALEVKTSMACNDGFCDFVMKMHHPTNQREELRVLEVLAHLPVHCYGLN